MKQTVGNLVLFFYLLPLAVNFGYVGDKPINFSLSTIGFVVVIIAIITLKKFHKRNLYALLLLSYFPILAIWGSIYNTGSTAPLYSGMSFSIVFIHILVGDWYFKVFGLKGFQKAPFYIVSIILAISISDLLCGNFPAGCSYEGRWGGYIGSFELYGFPNSSSTFLAILSPILVYTLLTNNKVTTRIFYSIGLACLILIVFMSLSRSASLVLLIALFLIILQIRFMLTIALVTILIGFSLFSGVFWSNFFLTRGLFRRIEIAVSNGDISNGRFDIWLDALTVIWESPIIGVAFLPFSKFSEYGTVHQQYLEILFKSGILGFIVYYGLMIYLFIEFRQSPFYLESKNRKELKICSNSFVIAILLASIFQPILTYQVLGALLFFLFGNLLASKKKNLQ